MPQQISLRCTKRQWALYKCHERWFILTFPNILKPNPQYILFNCLYRTHFMSFTSLLNMWVSAYDMIYSSPDCSVGTGLLALSFPIDTTVFYLAVSNLQVFLFLLSQLTPLGKAHRPSARCLRWLGQLWLFYFQFCCQVCSPECFLTTSSLVMSTLPGATTLD